MPSGAIAPLATLQAATAQVHYPPYWDEHTEKLYFAEVDGLVHVEFYGSPFEENYAALLARREVGAALRSLTLRGPDEGSNGTRRHFGGGGDGAG